MATQHPAIVQNENLHIPRGKGIEGARADLWKPEKKDHRERKALADLSKPAKPVVSAVLKGSTLKEKYSLHASETAKKAPKSSKLADERTKDHRDKKTFADLSKPAKPGVSAVTKGSTFKEKSSLYDNETTKKAPKSSKLTDEQIKKCHDWEEEEIEKCYFTGNDLWELEREAFEKRVQEEIDMVMSFLGKWNQDFYDCVRPAKEMAKDIEDIKILDLVPEPDLPRHLISSLPTSDIDEGKDLLLDEPEFLCWPIFEPRFELLTEDEEEDAPF